MKLFRIPWPYDYHKWGGIIVMASSADAAIELAKEAYTKEGDSDYYGLDPEWDKIEEDPSGVVFDYGCNC